MLIEVLARMSGVSKGDGTSPRYNPSMKLLVTLDRDLTGMIVAECPAIPGCVSQGQNETEALNNIREAIAGCLETRAARNMPLTIEVREIEVAV